MSNTIILPFKMGMKLYKNGFVNFEDTRYDFVYDKEEESKLIYIKDNIYRHNKWFLEDPQGNIYVANVDEVGEFEDDMEVIETDMVFTLIDKN